MSTDQKLHILQHSLGLDKYGQGDSYRNHFATSEGSKDHQACNELVESGLMDVRRNIEVYGGMDLFYVTDRGKEYVATNSLKPPKISKSKARYRRFLEYGDSFDSFIHFCYWDAEPEHPWNSGAAN